MLVRIQLISLLVFRWELEVQPLLPFLETAFVELADLVQEVDLPESKMQINEILGNLIIRVDTHVCLLTVDQRRTNRQMADCRCTPSLHIRSHPISKD